MHMNATTQLFPGDYADHHTLACLLPMVHPGAISYQVNDTHVPGHPNHDRNRNLSDQATFFHCPVLMITCAFHFRDGRGPALTVQSSDQSTAMQPHTQQAVTHIECSGIFLS